jgi:hypothetical protein
VKQTRSQERKPPDTVVHCTVSSQQKTIQCSMYATIAFSNEEVEEEECVEQNSSKLLVDIRVLLLVDVYSYVHFMSYITLMIVEMDNRKRGVSS